MSSHCSSQSASIFIDVVFIDVVQTFYGNFFFLFVDIEDPDIFLLPTPSLLYCVIFKLFFGYAGSIPDNFRINPCF